VTAPSKKIAEPVFNAARAALEVMNSTATLSEGLFFLPPDALQQQMLSADLVLVDEAASIPLPLLSDLVKQHSRLIFATTEHGYEGSGRGFAIRFRALLDVLSPEWKSARLEQPFRWQANDPLEKFSFDALLLDADIATLDKNTLNKIDLTACERQRIQPQALLANETVLREIFGLLVSAHYQTKPSDLVRLLDDENYLIFTMRYKTHLIATALMVKEGGFSASLADAIYAGQRRPQGHLIPQLLATHAGIKEAPCYHCHRIMRIAVHPQLQGQGIGSYLLQYLMRFSQQEKSIDYIATSFAATPSLISFWRKAGFKSVQIGIKRDASSGLHSLIMLHPLSANAHHLYTAATHHFNQALPLLLADPLRNLDTKLVRVLLEPSSQLTPLSLNKTEQDSAQSFAEQHRGYETSITALYKLTLHLISQPLSAPPYNLTPQEQQILIAKVLQKQPWQVLATLSQVTGRKQALILLRQAVKKLIYRYSDK
jgi:tRNA(Met) cytidine acetyltransferase